MTVFIWQVDLHLIYRRECPDTLRALLNAIAATGQKFTNLVHYAMLDEVSAGAICCVSGHPHISKMKFA
jgi:hypothetical protein